MILNARENSFQFNLPRKFIPDAIAKKYKPYLNRIPGNLIEEPIDFVNYTLQSINLPGMGFDAVEQDRKYGRKLQYRSSMPTQELFEKELTITFQLVDGYINYFILMETLAYYYKFENKKPFTDDLNIRLLDAEGNALVTSRLMRPLIKSLSDLQFSFASNVAEFTTFDLTLGYNRFEVVIELD